MKWTKQQEAAIEKSGRSLIVSAAAGSGKTAVLVERLLRILMDPEQQVRADSIIVVTFTNDAAAQMKRRLVRRMNEEIGSCTQSGDRRRLNWLLEQRISLSRAKICTISSFCFDLIRENAESIGVSPQFVIADEAQESLLRQRAMETVLTRYSERTEELELLYSVCCFKNHEELSAMITAIDNHLGSVAFPELWLTRALKNNTDAACIVGVLRDLFIKEAEKLLLIYQEIRDYAKCVTTDPKAPDKFSECWQNDYDAISAHLTYLRSTPPEELLKDPLAGRAAFQKYPAGSKGKFDPILKENYKNMRDTCKNLYNDCCTSYLLPITLIEEDLPLQKQVVPLLIEMTREYRRELTEAKRQQNVLSFADAEELTLQLLADVDADGTIRRTAFAEEIAAQHVLIMVDEYQDSNNKQDCIFKLLSRDCKADGQQLYYGTNAFLVGDLKQSIYGFRQANPENFSHVVSSAVRIEEDDSDELGVIYLNQNFRSAAGVLNFVNALFSTLMSLQCGGVAYNADEQLNLGSKLYDDMPQPPRTQLIFPSPAPGVVIPDHEDVQAEVIADTIRRMLDERVMVRDEDAPGKERPCSPKDFAVLLRSVKHSSAGIEEALRARGIPFRTDLDTNLIERPEVRLIRDILQVLDNPMADAPFAAMLLSPVFGFTPEDLANLKIYGKRRRIYLQMQALTHPPKPDGADETKAEPVPDFMGPLIVRCANVIALVEELREDAERLPLEDCIRNIYEKTDLLSLQSLYEDAAQRRMYLELFRQKAQSYRANADLTSQSGLSGWLRFLDRVEESKKKVEARITEPESSFVRIMTIHKSKGLQYPFVFLAHTESAFFPKSGKDQVLLAGGDSMLGLTFLRREKMTKGVNAAYTYLKEQSKARQVGEELRLLYVALTRAQQQLFWVTDQKIDTGAKKSPTAPVNIGPMLHAVPELAGRFAGCAERMQDWLLYFLHADAPQRPHLQAVRDYLNGIRPEDGIPKLGSSEIADFVLWTDYTAPRVCEASPVTLQEDADEELLTKMQDHLGFTYESTLKDIVAKHSVTELAHPDAPAEWQLNKPEFLNSNASGKLSGAARGTAAHKMMQFMDFGRAKTDAAAEVSRLIQEGCLTKPEAEALTTASIEAFLGSDLVSRMQGKEIRKEFQFHVRIGELDLPEHSDLAIQYTGTNGVLIGTMDLIFRDGDGWVLVDYKTDTYINGKPLQDEKQLVEEYALQLGLYQKAGELILGEPVKEAYLYSFHLNKAIPVDLDQIRYRSQAAAES